jgi:hypothetical protein
LRDREEKRRGKSMLLDYVSKTEFVLAVEDPTDYMTHIDIDPWGDVKKFPILSMSADGDTTSGGAAAERMFEIVNNMRNLQLAGQRVFSTSPVLRLFDIYIKQCGDKHMNFMFVMPFRDKDTLLWQRRSGAPAVQMLDAAFWQVLKKHGGDQLDLFRSSYKQLVRLMRPYLINLISKHYLLPEILSVCREDKKVGSCDGHKHFVRIQFDHYQNRESSKGTFGFHKDTVSCNTFRVALSFQNPVSMYGTEIIQCHSSISEPRCEQVVRLKLPPHGTISFNDFLLAHSSPTVIQDRTGSVNHPSKEPVINMQRGKVIKAFLEAARRFLEFDTQWPHRTRSGELHITALGFTLLKTPTQTQAEYDTGLAAWTRQMAEYNTGLAAWTRQMAESSVSNLATKKYIDSLVQRAMTNDIGRRYLGVSSTSHPAAPTLTVEVKDLQRTRLWKDEQGRLRRAPDTRRPPFFRLWFEVCDKQLAIDAKTAHLKHFVPLYLIIPIDQLSLDAGMGVLSTNTVEGAINSLLSEGMASVRTGGMKKKKKTRKRRRRKKRRKTKRRMRP